MPVLYLTTQGSRVRRKGETLVVDKDGEELARVPAHDLEAALVLGRVHLTTDAVRLLLRHGIRTAFLTSRGRLLGRLEPPVSKNAARRFHQAQRATDPSWRLAFARRVVLSKLRGAEQLIRGFAANHREAGVGPAARELGVLAGAAGEADSIDRLRGLEGTAARTYFRAFGAMCLGELRFEVRTRRPPTDPMNALLSFGYVLVGQELQSLADAVGLDPHIGLYHDIAYGRPSLALDLLEEFRHPVVDRLALNLNNLGVVNRSDFECSDQRGCRLRPPALARYLEAYEEFLTASRRSPDGAGDTSYRRVFRRQIERMARAMDDGTPYVPHNLAEGN